MACMEGVVFVEIIFQFLIIREYCRPLAYDVLFRCRAHFLNGGVHKLLHVLVGDVHEELVFLIEIDI